MNLTRISAPEITEPEMALDPTERIWLENADSGPARIEYRASNLATVALSSATLGSFFRLADATDPEVLTFARRYGVLGVCRNGRPVHSYGGAALGRDDRYWLRG